MIVLVVDVMCICVCISMNEVTVNENVLPSCFSCPLLSYFVVSLHTDRVRVYACVRKERERERQSASREQRTGEDGVRGKQEGFQE